PCFAPEIESLDLADADAVAKRPTIFLDEIEEPTIRVDHDRSRPFPGFIGDFLPQILRLHLAEIDRFNRERFIGDRGVDRSIAGVETRAACIQSTPGPAL